MAYYTVIVQWDTGDPASGRKVSLEVPDGYTDPQYTDSNGQTTFETSSNGLARVYVDGRDCGKMHPGSHVVTIRS